MVTKQAKPAPIRSFAFAIVVILSSLSLIVTLLSTGFAVCTQKPVTMVFANAFSNDEISPYLKDDLVSMAIATQQYTLTDSQRSTLGTQAAREKLCNLTVESARRATEAGSPVADRWSQAATNIVAESEGKSSVATTEKLAGISARYALDESAFEHLDDCYKLISGVKPLLIGCAAFSILSLLLLIVTGKRKAASRIMLFTPLLMAAFLIACGAWAAFDFNSFFAVFHGVLFPQGNWTFPYDSLLICMLPLNFWIGMAAVWLVVSGACCVLSIVISRKAMR